MKNSSIECIYYDSLLLKKLNTFPNILQDIQQLIILPRQQAYKQWPTSTDLDPLVDCFKELQSFIRNNQTWSESICTIQQLNKVQEDINIVLKLLRIQKIYIHNFWKSETGYRRIEASVAHFYAILQIFLRAFIPYETMTMFQCRAARKLCIKLEDLQKLIKTMIQKMDSIFNFLQRSVYEQENTIITNFFKNLSFFFQNIPKIKKLKMFHISELLKYVCLTNTLQFSNIVPVNRRKSLKWDYSTPKRKHYNRQKIRKQFHSWSYLKKHKNTHRKNVRKAKSSINLYFYKDIELSKYDQKFTPPIKIPQWIRRYSIVQKKDNDRENSFHELSPKLKSNTEFKKKGSIKQNRTQTLATNHSPTKTTSTASKQRRQTKFRNNKLNIGNVAGEVKEEERNNNLKIEKHKKILMNQKIKNLFPQSKSTCLCQQIDDEKEVNSKIKTCLQQFNVRHKIAIILKS